jgi:hypothetical protein
MSTDLRFLVGLSLGTAQDLTGLAFLERARRALPDEPQVTAVCYALRLLERIPPGTPYAEICDGLEWIANHAHIHRATLAIDYTGVGVTVLKQFFRHVSALAIKPILVTAGQKASADGKGGWYVPRRDLAGTLQVLLQERRLAVAASLPHAPTLVQELSNFRVREAAASDDAAVVSWRVGPQDDLVQAIAAACWVGEYAMRRLVIYG